MNPLLKVLPTDRLPHVYQILATAVGGAAVFVLCWYLSMQGLLDLAATAMSYFVVAFIRSSSTSLAKRAPSEFKKTASMVDTARAEFDEWMTNRKLLSRLILAVVVTVMFLVGRAIAATVMTLIASPWLALAIGLAVTALVISPVLFKAMADSFKGKEKSQQPGENQQTEQPGVPGHLT